MRKAVLGAMAGTLAVTGAVFVPAVASGEPARATASGIDWGPCDFPEAEKGVECATIDVPLDYAKPDGEKVQIGLSRRKAKDQGNRIGSLLMDPGGPGGSGVASVASHQPFPAKVADRFDVIGFDPRGVNTSSQVRCDGALTNQVSEALRPTSQAEFDKLADLNKKLSQSCRKNSGKLVDHIDNRHTARDMDAIRAALGEEKLNYVGYSYGTLMGQQYAEMFPDRIRSMVLDGNMDHSLRTASEFVNTEVEPVERTFVEFADWCDTTAGCALHGRDTKKVYAELKRKAKAGELTDPDGDKIDFYTLSGYANGTMSPEQWSQVASSLAAMADGKGTVTSSLASSAEPIENVMPAVWCRDWSYPVRDYAHYEKLRDELAKRSPNVEWTGYVDHVLRCVGSDFGNTNPRQPLEVEGAPPLVMIGNHHDPATPYRWSETAARQSGAELVTYEGYGHTIYGADQPSTCVNDAVDAYLVDGTVPQQGLTCRATEQPASGQGVAKRVPGSAGGPFATAAG